MMWEIPATAAVIGSFVLLGQALSQKRDREVEAMLRGERQSEAFLMEKIDELTKKLEEQGKRVDALTVRAGFKK